MVAGGHHFRVLDQTLDAAKSAFLQHLFQTEKSAKLSNWIAIEVVRPRFTVLQSCRCFLAIIFSHLSFLCSAVRDLLHYNPIDYFITLVVDILCIFQQKSAVGLESAFSRSFLPNLKKVVTAKTSKPTLEFIVLISASSAYLLSIPLSKLCSGRLNIMMYFRNKVLHGCQRTSVQNVCPFLCLLLFSFCLLILQFYRPQQSGLSLQDFISNTEAPVLVFTSYLFACSYLSVRFLAYSFSCNVPAMFCRVCKENGFVALPIFLPWKNFFLISTRPMEVIFYTHVCCFTHSRKPVQKVNLHPEQDTGFSEWNSNC